MASSTFMVGKNVGVSHWGIHKMESKMGSVKWVGGWGGENSQKQNSQSETGSCEEVEELNALEKADGRIFPSHFMVLCARILYCEKWSDRSSQSAGCWCFSECQISGCYPVILLVCLNMAGIPEKHWRLHYLALWTGNPKYIFSHYSSLFYLQSKDESPDQRTPVAHGIIVTCECSLLWGELWSPGLYTSLPLLSSPLCRLTKLCCGLDFFPECDRELALETQAEACSLLPLLFHWVR